MAPNLIHHRLGCHVLEEAQLLAEKKWILNAISKIKNQRNCLQIERFHLESLKTRVKSEAEANVAGKMQQEGISNNGGKSAVGLMQNVPKNLERFGDAGLNDTDEDIYCNEQALDLMISRIYANNHESTSNNIEEDEEDDDDIMIDMDMLMNGQFK